MAYVDALKSTRAGGTGSAGATSSGAAPSPVDPGAALAAVSEALGVRPGDPDLLEVLKVLERLF